MRAKKYRKMKKEELGVELLQKREELTETRYNVRVGKEKDYAQLKELRKEIAILLGVLDEKLEDENINSFLNKIPKEK